MRHTLWFFACIFSLLGDLFKFNRHGNTNLKISECKDTGYNVKYSTMKTCIKTTAMK